MPDITIGITFTDPSNLSGSDRSWMNKKLLPTMMLPLENSKIAEIRTGTITKKLAPIPTLWMG